MGEMELSCRAYVKMYLHCCLFPRCSINGLLLSSGPTHGAVCVTDCVPLLHSHLSLAPITQLALTQVRPTPAPRPVPSLCPLLDRFGDTSLLSGGCLVLADAAEDCGILSS